MEHQHKRRGQWASSFGFLMAAVGSAVGLGNLWRFPVMLGQNGGFAFLLVYVIAAALIGVCMLLGELAIGRKTGLNVVGAFQKLNKRYWWIGAGAVGVVSIILPYYNVIGGWVCNYIAHYAGALFGGGFGQLDSAQYFAAMTGDVWGPLAWNAVFIAITAAVVLGGVEKGIERSAKVMMPVLAVMLLITIARSLSLPGAWEGVAFLFKPDFSKLNMGTVSAAMSQMFYSLSLGMGIMVTYGSYLSKTDNMQRSAVLIPVFDTAVALMAGLAIMPAVFAFNLQPDMGPSLIFVTLRDVFASIPLGDLFGLVFFALVFMAALTSMISMMEVVAAYFIDTFHFNRKKVALTIALAAFVVGIPSSLSFGVLKNVTLFGMNIFDFMDYLANNVLLPLTGLCTCLFIGWVWKSKNAVREISNDGALAFQASRVWSFIIKFIAPIVIFIVFLSSIGVIR